MVKRPSSRDTKAEILKEYDQLFEQNKELTAQLEQLQRDIKVLEKRVPPVMETVTPFEKKVDHTKEQKEIVISKPSMMDNIVENLTLIRSDFGKAVNDLSAKLVAEASTLAALQNKVKEEIHELEALYDLKVSNETLNSLIQQYTKKLEMFEKEIRQRQEAFEQEIVEKKNTWKKEQDEYAQTVKERNEWTEINFQRDEAEYKYNLELQRKLENEDFQMKLKKLKRELDSFEEEKKKEWDERENTIAERENEFNDLKQKVDKFPKELETAINDAKVKAAEIARSETQKKSDLHAKEIEGINRVYELKIKSLEEIVKQQNMQIQNLATKLDATLKQAQALAIKAIEGASNISSFQSVKEIAMEQAKKVKSE